MITSASCLVLSGSIARKSAHVAGHGHGSASMLMQRYSLKDAAMQHLLMQRYSLKDAAMQHMLMQRYSLKDAAMQHHGISQWTPTHAANSLTVASRPYAITSGAKSDEDMKRSSLIFHIPSLSFGLDPLLSGNLRFGSISICFSFAILELLRSV